MAKTSKRTSRVDITRPELSAQVVGASYGGFEDKKPLKRLASMDLLANNTPVHAHDPRAGIAAARNAAGTVTVHDGLDYLMMKGRIGADGSADDNIESQHGSRTRSAREAYAVRGATQMLESDILSKTLRDHGVKVRDD